ncbi:glycosyltransferase [Microbacterium timonense]|uniref:glycosyltransferase n=1 Tax=Microbacterium timonense TaxID=2086576 RepID=UPI000D0FAE19|nr:glycosyltransferase [Microbacterium timonense]
MARFLISAMPFTGHVNPIRAVATALMARGHDVRVYTGAAFRVAVESTGARLVPWRHAPDFDENNLVATFPRLQGRKGIRQVLVNVEEVFIHTAAAQVQDLHDEWAREPWDVLASDDVSIGAALYAAQSGGPWATISVTPLNLFGPQGPPSGLGLRPGTNPITKARDAALRAAAPLFARPLGRAIAKAEEAIGLRPRGLTMEQVTFSRQLIVASGSPLLDFERTDRPGFVHFVGELRMPPSVTRSLPEWWSELDGRRVVHVTQGTQNIDPADLIEPTLEALADRDDLLVVVATGVAGVDELPFPVPSNTRVAGFLPYAALLPRVDVAVTNGGWGGTLAMLAHGIPLVIAGGDLDKPEVASRVAWTGAAVDLKTGTPTSAQVAAGLDTLLSAPSYRDAAARVGAQLRSLGGADRAAELLERALLKGDPPSAT